MLNKKSKIFIAGHKGMVGASIQRKLKKLGYTNLLVVDKKKINLLDQKKVFNYLKKNKPSLVIIAAAKVGGILANSKNKDIFLYENLQIQNNLIHGAYLAKIKNLIFLGSSCIYPKYCKQPMKEKYLLSGSLEETNEAYSLAKIMGIKMCEYYSFFLNLNYKSLMPPNLYGPNDNFDLNNSHFYPALIKKIYLAKKYKKKKLDIWGTGKAKRELMFVDDFADAAVFFMKKKIKEPFLNIGTGEDHQIDWYAKMLMRLMNVKLKINYDTKKPDGMPRKCLDIGLAKKYGWKPKNDYQEGFRLTFQYFLNNHNKNEKNK